MNFFLDKTGKNISEEDAQHSAEYKKIMWMREARIRTFMQLKLESCLGPHLPAGGVPGEALPIPPNYIGNLQSRLIKVNKGILPPTLK